MFHCNLGMVSIVIWTLSPYFFPQPRLILASRQDLASYARGMFLQAMEAQRIARNYAKSAKRSLRQVESLKQAKVNKNAANLPLLFFLDFGIAA